MKADSPVPAAEDSRKKASPGVLDALRQYVESGSVYERHGSWVLCQWCSQKLEPDADNRMFDGHKTGCIIRVFEEAIQAVMPRA